MINTTDHLQLSRECKRGLLKMTYCPHCQGLTRSRPCMGYCLNVLRGCLASLAEVLQQQPRHLRALYTSGLLELNGGNAVWAYPLGCNNNVGSPVNVAVNTPIGMEEGSGFGFAGLHHAAGDFMMIFGKTKQTGLMRIRI